MILPSPRTDELLAGELPIASLKRRGAAALITMLVVVGVLGLIVACARWAQQHLSDRLRLSAVHRRVRAISSSFSTDWLTSPWGQRAVTAVSLPAAVRLRHLRGPGARVMRIRRVELATGQPVTARASIVQELTKVLLQMIVNLILRPVDRRARTRQAVLEPSIAELRQQHAGDEQALDRALADLYRRQGVHPFEGCVVKVAAHLIAGQLPTLLSPLNQDIPERIAGTVLIVDEPPV